MQSVWEASWRGGSRVLGCSPPGAFVRGVVAALVLATCGGGLVAGPVWAQGGLCANEQLRSEQPFALGLGDCRAYEMVSPLAKDDNGVDGRDSRAAAGGGAIMYFSQGSFAEPRSALLNVPYIARRGVAGWVTQGISPPYTEYQGHALYSEFGESLFTEDLSHGVVEGFDTPLVSGQPVGYVNLYVANIEAGSYEPVTTDTPPKAEYQPFGKIDRNGDTQPEAVGASSDLSHVVFQFRASLCCGASPQHTHVYEEAGGVLRQVDVPPEGGSKLEGDDNVGAAASFSWPESTGNPWRAVSGDGSRVVFTGGEKDAGFSEPLAGQVYMRENPLSGVDSCSVAGGACTVEVSASQRTNGNGLSGNTGPDPNAGKGPLEGTAWYRGANVDGSRVFFTSRVELTNDADTREDNAANLYECEIAVEHEKCKLRDLTPENAEGGGVLGLVTASEDGSYVYFVAEGVLTNGKNVEGREPVAGQPNLYLSHGGSVSFIATLAPRVGGGEFLFADALGNGNGDEEDWVGEEGPTLHDFGPGQHSVRVSGDGTLLAFTSELGLTAGFDNRPAAAGECEDERCREVYLFDAVSGRLVCVSCDFGSQPVGPSALGGHESMGLDDLGEQSPFYIARNISEGGGRVFFQSADALVPQDSNGLLDVYEWERPGVGSCTESVPEFRAGSGGCVFPVSDVAGGSESFFMDASVSGDDAFIATADQLVSSDTDSREDVYDVRVGGGFPVTVAPPVCTNADSCKPPVSLQPGVFGVPASATFSGVGNLVSSNRVPSSSHIVCAKSKRLVRGRCVAKKKQKVKAKKKAKARRAAGRARSVARAGGRLGVVS
jgi:hypothetical protein